MIIKESVYKQIISYCPLVPPETGGIIGSSSTFIDTVAFDNYNKIIDAAVYVPDVRRLNAILSNWQKDKISFCGLFHSHKKGQETLSKDDIEYIHTIFSCLPLIIPHSGKHESAGRKTSIRGAENADSRKERCNSPKERISCRI